MKEDHRSYRRNISSCEKRACKKICYRLQYGLLLKTELHSSARLMKTKDGSVEIFVRFSLDSCKQVLSNNNGEPTALFTAAGRSLKSQREVLTKQCNFVCTHMVEPT